MNTCDIIESVAVTVAALVAFVTLVLTIVKEVAHAKSSPSRRHLEYVNDFGDFIANFGSGIMRVTSIEIYYDGELVQCNSLVKLYKKKLGTDKKLTWSTFLSNEEILNRNIAPNSELRLVEINPDSNSTNEEERQQLLQKLIEIRNSIKLKIVYKEIYGKEKTATI